MTAATHRDGPEEFGPGVRGGAGTVDALGAGTDAVLVARVDAAGSLCIEVVNDPARTLFGISPDATALDDDSCDPAIRPLLQRVRDGATRARATREHIALVFDDRRAVVDMQIEPLPGAGDARVLAVIRLSDAAVDEQPAAPTAGVFRTELGLGTVFVDDALLLMLGLSPEHALGYGWLESIHPDDRERVTNALDRTCAPDEALEIECRISHGSVRDRLVRIRAVPVRGDDGAQTGYLGSIEDVTDEHRNARAVARLSELAEVLEEWIVIADADLRFHYANPAARAGLALPDDFRHVRVHDVLPRERAEALLRNVAQALDAGNQWTGDAMLLALDGRHVELACKVVAHRAPNGDVAHYSLVAGDVTSLRTMQRALDESETRFRLIADSSPMGIYFVGDGGIVSYANRRLAEMLGESVDRVVGRSFLEWVHPDDLSRAAESGEIMAAQRLETNLEVRIRRPSGEVRWLRAQGAPVVDAGVVVHGVVGSCIDVTDDRALQRGLAMLGRAVESTPDLVTFHDAGGRMFFANAAARHFFGVGAADAVPPLGPADYLDAPADVLAEIEHAFATKGQWSGELTAVNGHGRNIPVEVVVVAHRDEHGTIEYYSALSRDLTDRKVVEAARRRSETALRAIVQASPLAIFALDRRGVVHMWNRASEDLFGWSSDEVVGGTPPFVVDDTRADFDDLIGRVFNGRTVKGYLGRYARRSGDLLDVDVSIAPLRNTDGRVVTAVAVMADVTEQKRATQALRESEVWYRSLVQHSSDMVIVIADDGTVTYVSPSASAFVGVSAREALGRRVNEVMTAVEDDLAALQHVFAQLRSAPGATERATFRAIRADGALRRIEMSISNLVDDPAVRGIVVNARDITESFEADAAVRASEERLRALVSGASDAICVLSADGTVTYTSPVAEVMLRGAADDADSVFSALEEDDLPRALELWQHTLATPGMSRPAQVSIRRGDGTTIDVEVVANNLLDDPSVQGIVMTIRDVTERKRSELALHESDVRLRESEARYRAVVDDQVELVCRYLADTTITFVNRAFADFYGRDTERLVGTRLIDLRAPASHTDIVARLRRFRPGNELQTFDEWELGADGLRRCIRWIDRAFIDDDGTVVEVQSVGHDVTDERRASVLTSNQADILEQVARGVPLNETLHAIATTVEQHFPKLSCAVFLRDDDGAMRLAASPTLARNIVTDDNVAPVWATPIYAADGTTMLGTVAAFGHEHIEAEPEQERILSLVAHLASIAIERKAFEERLAHQSMHDPLTGLPNRVLFLDRLNLAIARARRTFTRVAVLFLDLDRFKNVNDSLGHEAGDELLVSVAQRLSAVLRPGDSVARFGGDEFTILCEDLPDDGGGARAIDIAQRLVATMSHPFLVREAETYVGVSVGIAMTDGKETAEELLRDADAAMYHAKEAGRGRIEVFDDTIRARALARHSTENALHRAIERGELRLFFQPIIDLTQARCIGTEALVRWQHPELGLVSPAEFVPLAEETGLVRPLGMWVLEEAAAQAARWQFELSDFSVSVNLSARQLVEPDLVDEVAEVIRRNGVSPSNICFEITESVLMNDADAVIRAIGELRALGVRFAIDDFGTGYSSLGYLKQLEVDTVKIDREFIRGLGEDSGDQAIVSAVVGLAHALGLTVVAEGVETEAQLEELIDLGCDEAQGYFFAPPQPSDDLRTLVSGRRRWRPPGAHLMGR